MVGRGFRLDPSKENCLVLDFGGNILRHGPVDALEIKDRAAGGGGEAPAKECPQCQAVIHAAYSVCPDCGYEFPQPKREQHEREASTASVLSGEVTETEHEVKGVTYSVHIKRDAPEGHPRTMRVDYRVGFHNYKSEWVCFEHSGLRAGQGRGVVAGAVARAVSGIVRRGREDLRDGRRGRTVSITVRAVSGEKYDRITHYKLGLTPPRLDGSDEVDDGTLPEYQGPEDDDLPSDRHGGGTLHGAAAGYLAPACARCRRTGARSARRSGSGSATASDCPPRRSCPPGLPTGRTRSASSAGRYREMRR
jgi:hypothetical protein